MTYRYPVPFEFKNQKKPLSTPFLGVESLVALFILAACLVLFLRYFHTPFQCCLYPTVTKTPGGTFLLHFIFHPKSSPNETSRTKQPTKKTHSLKQIIPAGNDD